MQRRRRRKSDIGMRWVSPRKPCPICSAPTPISTGATRRGICYRCFKDPSVRESLPPSKYACRGVADRCGAAPMPAEPTGHPPGSPGKIEVLCQRAARGERLWHPGDAGWEAAAAKVVEAVQGEDDWLMEDEE